MLPILPHILYRLPAVLCLIVFLASELNGFTSSLEPWAPPVMLSLCCLHFQFAQNVHSSFSSDYSHNTQPEIANHPRCPHLSFVFVTSWPISWPSKNSKPPSPTHLFILLVLPGVHSYPPHSFCLSKSSLFLKTQLNSFSFIKFFFQIK